MLITILITVMVGYYAGSMWSMGMLHASPQIVEQSNIDYNNFTYMPHYVKFHILPEREGLRVTAIPEGRDVALSGLTDNNSDVVFEMVSTLKYNLIIGFDFPPCQYYIIPTESEYSIRC